MLLEQLCETIKPPKIPSENGGDKEWQKIEREIGTKLPEDYKSLINIFGTGCFAGFIWVFNPFTKNENLNLLKQISKQLSALKTLEEQFGENCLYPTYPEPKGLLPCAVTDNGDVLFWLTDDDPNNWQIVIHAARESEYEKFAVSITSFLQNLVIGNIDSQIITHELLDQDILFKSIN